MTKQNRYVRPRKWWLWRILLTIDQGANVLLSPLLNLFLPDNAVAWFGYEDETLSSVLGKNRRDCEACYWVCIALNFLQRHHCERSIETDEGKQ